MLVLTRKVGAAVILDGRIRVEVMAIRGQNVKLGIQAPAQVGILREELVNDQAGRADQAASGPEGSGSSRGGSRAAHP